MSKARVISLEQEVDICVSIEQRAQYDTRRERPVVRNNAEKESITLGFP